MKDRLSHLFTTLKSPVFIRTALILLVLVLFSGFSVAHEISENRRLDAESVTLKTELSADFGQAAQVSDFLADLQGDLVEDIDIHTDQLGPTEVEFEYINAKGRKRSYKFTIDVVDQTAPIIYGRNSYTVYRGYTGDLTDLMLSVDDLDDHPTRQIVGDYDLNTAGDYQLEYAITDASDNTSRQPFVLHVVEPSSVSDESAPIKTPKLALTDVITQHKTTRTKIGIDVSAWQGEIDWSAVKAAGVEFAFLRIGYQVGYGGEYVLDRYFEANLAGATAAGLPIGVYFYSYADNTEQATAQASWILDQISGHPLELGIAFDWEDWANFNAADMSLHTINQVAAAYLDTVNAAGYQGSLYGSKNYLQRIWRPGNYPVWLAQYYDYVTYDRPYWIWQMSSSGRVPGIDGNVDLDIMYLE